MTRKRTCAIAGLVAVLTLLPGTAWASDEAGGPFPQGTERSPGFCAWIADPIAQNVCVGF
jgi:hypothetical protein